jgi:hypothetical protein
VIVRAWSCKAPQTHALGSNGIFSPRGSRIIGAVQKVNVFLASMDNFDSMNAVHARHIQSRNLARTTVAVQALPMGAAIEIDVVAACP